MARTASKPATNGGKVSPNKTAEVADDLLAAFNSIKAVNGIYQQEVERGAAPDLFMYGEVGVIALPLASEQARKIVSAAFEGDFNMMDTDASSLPIEPACVFNEGSFDINNPSWDKYVQELAEAAMEGLGMDGGEVMPALDGMWLWTQDCVWTTPPQKVRTGGDRRTWAAKMLILLPSAHEGGEITYSKSGHVESYATAGYRESMICWNKDMEHLDFKPPTKGQRLGLLYDLHVPRPTAYNKLRGNHHKAVQALQDAIEKYTVFVRNGSIAETAFFLPLKTKISGRDITSVNKDKLVPSDLAKVECFSEKGMDVIRGFRTDLALVLLTARQFMTISRECMRKATVSNTEYILGDMVDTDGGDDLGESVRHLGGVRFNKESVLDVDAFASGVTRLVAHKGQIEEHVFVKTALCLMVYFEKIP